MSDVLDFNERLAAKKQEDEKNKAMEFFWDMFGDQPNHIKLEIAKAIQEGNKERYMELTQPIIIRKTMMEFNKD